MLLFNLWLEYLKNGLYSAQKVLLKPVREYRTIDVIVLFLGLLLLGAIFLFLLKGTPLGEWWFPQPKPQFSTFKYPLMKLSSNLPLHEAFADYKQQIRDIGSVTKIAVEETHNNATVTGTDYYKYLGFDSYERLGRALFYGVVLGLVCITLENFYQSYQVGGGGGGDTGAGMI